MFIASPDKAITKVISPSPGQNLRFQLQSMNLRVISGPDAGLEVSVCLPSLRLGTALDNDVVLSDRTVSRHHAEVRMTPHGLVLCDLGSTNGTFIDNLRISEAYLPAGSMCTLGYSRIAVQQRAEQHQAAIANQSQLGDLVGASAPMRELYALMQAIAPTPATVLISGESGSGKETVSRELHRLSGRRGSFVVFDAAVTDPEMVRSDLFGHLKGAFTGAANARTGAFRRAHKGTLLIDEVGELPLDLQPRLLRVLESREVTPIGADSALRVDVRVIAATHRNLESMVKEETFRADLYYRLAVVPLRVPSLREIRSDIPLLLRHLCDKLELRCKISAEAMTALENHSWPGNVRELRNVLERAAILASAGEIRPQDLRLSQQTRCSDKELRASPGPVFSHLKELEQQMILSAMARNGNNKAAVARELRIPLSTLKRRLKDYYDAGTPDHS
jgi:DNA-binding NtrC family response regulator